MNAERIYPNPPGSRRNRDTSIAAAVELAPKLKSMQIRIADAIRAAGSNGLTSDESGELTGISIYTSRARCAELQAMGWIKDSTQRRKNGFGRSCRVWVWIDPTDRTPALPANDAEEPTCSACGAPLHRAPQ